MFDALTRGVQCRKRRKEFHLFSHPLLLLLRFELCAQRHEQYTINCLCGSFCHFFHFVSFDYCIWSGPECTGYAVPDEGSECHALAVSFCASNHPFKQLNGSDDGVCARALYYRSIPSLPEMCVSPSPCAATSVLFHTH